MIQEMTVKEYAKIRRVSSVAVTRAINKGKTMIGVQSVRKIGRDWVLMVFRQQAETKPKKYLVI